MNNGNVETRIKNIVNDLPNVTWEQIIYEAITNSIQANATNIKIDFSSNSLDMKDTNKYIDAIKIIDNGDGFNQKNTASFKEYKTDLKKDLGCKGIGRFLYLKVFENISIESLNKKIELVIDKDIIVEDVELTKKDTSLIFTHPNKSNKKNVLNYNDLEQNIKNHFIAYFKLLKDNNKEVNIQIFENNIELTSISSNEIPTFKSKTFSIKKHNFKFSYILNDENIQVYDGFYCAGGRVVIKNSHLDSIKKFKPLDGIDILYLLEGNYLDNNVNESRDNFSIYPKKINQNDLLNSLSWSEIRYKLKNEIKIIAKENGIDIDMIANENLTKAIKESPFLGHYLKDNKEMFESDVLIQNAKKALEKDKVFLRTNNNMDAKYHHKLTIVTQSELAEYMFDRQKIINKLKQLTDNNSLEKEIHQLFMPQNTSDEEESYKTNNLWLFDDRFMSYDKVFSEAEIKDIFPELSNNIKRPDILSIVSNTSDKNEITDVVIIELKRPKEIITPEGAEAQLLKYARFIGQSNLPNDVRIWTYAFLKFNNEIHDDLDDKDYNKIPTHSEYPIYYKYHEKRNSIINFMDYRALASDADNRHKTFMKILSAETI